MRALAWLMLLHVLAALLVLAWFVGCTCVVNEANTPTGHVADGGLVELEDSGADSL